MTMDQPYETGKQDLLLAYMGEGFLREFANDSASLARRIDLVIERIEASAAPAGNAAIASR
jgi:hypothetical protein